MVAIQTMISIQLMIAGIFFTIRLMAFWIESIEIKVYDLFALYVLLVDIFVLYALSTI